MSATQKFGNGDGIGQHRDRYIGVKQRWRRAALAFGAVALVIASCSSDDTGPAAEPPVGGAATTTNTDTTAPTSPVTMSPTTTPESTAPQSTEAPGLTAASTIESPPEPAAPAELLSEDGAAAAVMELFGLWTICLEELPDCDPVVISSNYAGEYSNVVFVQATSWADGRFSFTNTESRRNSVESVSVDADAGTATVIACEDDGAILSNGENVAVDDRYVSVRREWQLVVIGDRWIGTGISDLDRAEGVGNELCDI